MADSVASRLLEWERGGNPGPWFLTLMPTNRCNLRCAICWQRDFENLTDGISDDRMRALVDEAAELGVREWCFAGGGEPALRGEVVISMCERIRALGMDGAVLTNGIAFKKEYAERLIKAGWSTLTFSLDGPTRESNDAIRSAGSFDRATATIRQIGQYKRDSGSVLPHIIIHSTITSLNFDKLDRMVELAHDLECDVLNAGELTPTAHNKPFMLNPEQLARLPEEVAKAGERAHELGVTQWFESLHAGDMGQMRQVFPGFRGLGRAFCFEPWLSTIIHADGKVGPCCVYWEETCPSIVDQSLVDIWRGPWFTEMRRRLLADDRPPICKKCPPPPTLRERDSKLRMELFDLRKTKTQYVHYMAWKTWNSLRRHGLKKALRRGLEWLQIKRRKR